MSDETVYHNEIRAALEKDPAPPVNLGAIYGYAPQVRRPEFPAGRIAAITAAAFAASLLIMPQAQAIVQSMEMRVDSALRAMGITPGPPVPQTFVTMLGAHTHRADLAQAAKQVPFDLVQPQGLPADARLTKIYVSPTGQWNGRAAKWHVSSNIVMFEYTRAHGRSFVLQASQYDPSQRISAYMWQLAEKPNGDPVFTGNKVKLIRNDAIHWRNGNQLMTAIALPGLSKEEAQNIERAMNGIDIPGIKTRRPHSDGTVMVVKP